MEAILSQQSNHGRANGEPADTRKHGLSTTTTSHDEHEGGKIDSPVTSPVSSPPYWVQSHTRSFSNISVESIPAGAITLQDNTDEGDTKNKACWARSVYIEDHVIINGSRTGIGAFVVWNITVETLRVRCRGAGAVVGLVLTMHCRVVPCGFANDTRSLTTCEISCSKPSQTPRLRCLRCLQRASYPSSGRSFWRIGGVAYNTSSSECSNLSPLEGL